MEILITSGSALCTPLFSAFFGRLIRTVTKRSSFKSFQHDLSFTTRKLKLTGKKPGIDIEEELKVSSRLHWRQPVPTLLIHTNNPCIALMSTRVFSSRVRAKQNKTKTKWRLSRAEKLEITKYGQVLSHKFCLILDSWLTTVLCIFKMVTSVILPQN
ncbi:hypothetical protein PoB_001450200 [Plakobranchus ocellatus]|uniref:Uncharacterized protein n=1 Tax=Plakobranchus ocellatus TaxID=259542 RepID=A0AAV3Z0J0_9GAST|nr:hypothetical protein PoB_001450200 [Plakobranchus ocellatus]